MKFEEWWAANGDVLPTNEKRAALATWNAAIAAASEAAETHGFESEVGPDPLACQGCAEEVAENIRTLKASAE